MNIIDWKIIFNVIIALFIYNFILSALLKVLLEGIFGNKKAVNKMRKSFQERIKEVETRTKHP